MVARSIAIGTLSAIRNRLTLATMSVDARPRTMVSSGDGAKMPFSIQRDCTELPRRAISSLKEVRVERDCSTFCISGAMKVPEPGFCTTSPRLASSCTALLTVTRERPVMAAISRSEGNGSPCRIRPVSIAFSIWVCNCR